MLVLSRKSGESIEIGDQPIIVRVLATRGSKVQLGIDAPPEVAIHRSEKVPRRSNRVDVDSVTKGRKEAALGCRQRPAPQTSSPSGPSVLGASFLGASSLGDGVLQDLALTQTEIATLAEMASESDRTMARQIAAKAVERLTTIERALRVLTRQSFERPIAAFVESRSERLQQTGSDEQEAPVDSGDPARNRDVKPPATLVREPASDYRLVPLT